MYALKITGLAEQRDMQALERVLLRMPGLNMEVISRGLKYPPFRVFSSENEGQIQSIKNVLEKHGATCEIEDVDKIRKEQKIREAGTISYKEEQKKFEWRFWVTIITVMTLLIIVTVYFSKEDQSKPKPAQPATKEMPAAQAPRAGAPSANAQAKTKTSAAKSKEDLQKDLVRNSYNPEAWKALSEKLEEEGDEAAARTAKENYDRAVKAQMVLSSLAKAFGNNVRVEITEDAVYYRTSKNFTESEFYHEASRLRDSLSVTFPGKRNLVIENYTSDNRMQRIVLEPN